MTQESKKCLETIARHLAGIAKAFSDWVFSLKVTEN